MIGTNVHASFGSSRGAHKTLPARDAFAHKILFVAMFAIFLPAALVRRALPAPQTRAGVIRRSVFEEAKIAASTVSAYAFMG